jgi:hypothetical protein
MDPTEQSRCAKVVPPIGNGADSGSRSSNRLTAGATDGWRPGIQTKTDATAIPRTPTAAATRRHVANEAECAAWTSLTGDVTRDALRVLGPRVLERPRQCLHDVEASITNRVQPVPHVHGEGAAQQPRDAIWHPGWQRIALALEARPRAHPRWWDRRSRVGPSAFHPIFPI